jgi:opacity protein-like surface antigen
MDEDMLNKSLLLCLLLLPVAADAAHAQAGPAARTWLTAFGQMYTRIDHVTHPGEPTTVWVFDDNAFGFGLGVERDVGQGLMIGAEGSFARPAYERRIQGTNVVIHGATGTATIATGMLTGRFAYGGGAQLGFYLTGGLGTVAYHLEDLAEWNSDFALRAGTGLEYRFAAGRAAYLEWGRLWGYHEREGIGGGAAQHSVLKLGFRAGR